MVDFKKLNKERKTADALRQLGLFQDKVAESMLLDPFSDTAKDCGAGGVKPNIEPIDFTAPEVSFPKTIDLSPDQETVYKALVAWSRSPSGILRMGGYAGSGKSTLTGIFARRVCAKDRVAFISYTGRASGILGRKLAEAGVRTTSVLADAKEENLSRGDMTPLCTTIHRFLYRPAINDQEEITGWVKREAPDRQYRFIVIDEASMVGDRILADIQEFGVPILAVGDHGQLAPVQDSGSLMKDPDLRLEQIHRQAADNPIIQLASRVRRTGFLTADDCKEIRFRRKDQLKAVIRRTHKPDRAISDVGMLCWTNKSRVMLNDAARSALGFSRTPKKGEPLVCLRNIQGDGVWNGMRGWLTADAAIDGRQLRASIEFPEETIPSSTFRLCAPQFRREKTFISIEELQACGVNVRVMGAAGNLFDFGYAMTVHKYQGSQVGTVILLVDRPVEPRSEDWRRWAYTAVTRASKRIILIR